jgi:hypothetical protein
VGVATVFPLLVALTVPHPLDERYPEVRIEDAQAFGIAPIAARNGWFQACRHRSAMRDTVAGGWNNDPETVSAWELECEKRARAWCVLDDALYADLPLRSKLRALNELRTILGPEDYHAGRMVSPFPSYRIPTR